MHPQDFKSITDHLYDAYCSLHEELQRLKKENKSLAEELNRTRNINNSLSAKLSNLNSSKILKMGAEWFLDGDPLLKISLAIRMKFYSPICNAKISRDGQIAFTCNDRIFLLKDGKIFLVEETMKIFDIKLMKHDLVDLKTRVFAFAGEALLAYHNSAIMKFQNMECEWFIEIDNVIQIESDENYIYIGTHGGLIHLYSHDGGFIRSIEVENEFKMFFVRNGEILLVFNDTMMINPNLVLPETKGTLGVDFDGNSIYYGGKDCMFKIATHTGSNIQHSDSILFKSTILSILKYKNYLFCATEDRTVSVMDLENKKTMRIAVPDKIIDMCCNDDLVCFVDNNGGIRVWNVIK